MFVVYKMALISLDLNVVSCFFRTITYHIYVFLFEYITAL